MSRAALYLRVSNDDKAVSLDAQDEGGRAWCAREGHSVVAVYRDEGVSGAEWTNRPGVNALRDDARRSPRPFDLVVARDLDRLGRDNLRTPLLVSDLGDAGVRVVEWSQNRVVELDPAQMLVVQVRQYGAAEERRQISQRTRTALRQRVERGDVAGAKVYGYRHVRDGDRVRYEVDEAEAAVVREIYERAAAGESGRAIARALDARGVRPPRAATWAGATVHLICRSTRYRGELTWGLRSTAYRGGSRVAVAGDNVVRGTMPAIVDPDLWQRAQARSVAVAFTRPSSEPHHLLVGHAVCDACGGPLASYAAREGDAGASYRCGRRANGRALCPATFVRRSAPYDRGLLAALAAALDGDAVRAALALARGAHQSPTRDTRREELEAAVARAEQRAERLARAIELGDDDVAELVARRRSVRAEADAARTQLADLPPAAPVIDLATERDLVAVAADLGASLLEGYEVARAGDVGEMRRLRAVVGAALRSPLRATQEPDGAMVIRGELHPGGVVELSRNPTGAGQRHAAPLAGWAVPVLLAGAWSPGRARAR